jgi:hypothetical protein
VKAFSLAFIQEQWEPFRPGPREIWSPWQAWQRPLHAWTMPLELDAGTWAELYWYGEDRRLLTRDFET